MIDAGKIFALQGNVISCEAYGSGHINRTFLVCTDAPHAYVLQRVNTDVFADVDMLMDNIARVTRHLAAKGLDARHVLTVVPTRDGRLYHRCGNGDCWRMYERVEGGVCLQQADTAQAFYQSAVAFGQLHMQLADFPADTLGEVIPRFHDTPNRYRALREAAEKDVCGRASSVQQELAFALAREADADALVSALREKRIPLRVTHNDTKLNNVMLDEQTMEPLCVLDLDTVMPGAVAYDFGDSIRFGASTAEEDEKDLDRVWMDLGMYEAYVQGYLSVCGAFMTEAEKASLPVGARLMTLECGVRFLTDYLQGDPYFATHYPGQNLIRCRTQFKLVADMESKWDKMNHLIRKYGG